MDEIWIIITALLAGLLFGGGLGALVGWLLAAAKTRKTVEAEAELNLAEVQEELDQAQDRLIESARAAAAAEARSATQQEQIQQFIRQQQLDKEKSDQESRVLQAISPVQETLRTMQQKVAELEQQRSEQYGQIRQQLIETKSAGEQIRATAETLASALKANSTRGVWGEVQLKNIVEAAGLINHVDFNTQVSATNSGEASIRPDLVIKLPGGKTIAVDAKVPFNKYLEASAIPATASSAELAHKEALLKEHSRALKSHIDALSKKEYWSGFENSPEFTVAFIPSESLIAAALEADTSLMDYAFSKKVALSSPVTLWSVLKTVAYSWQQDTLTKDAKQLFDLGKQLYERLGTLGDHANTLKRSLDRTVTAYNAFASTLESRVLVTGRKLSWLDESKILPEISQLENSAKTLTAGELSESETSGEAENTLEF